MYLNSLPFHLLTFIRPKASSDQRVGIITASDTLALSEVATNHCKAQLNASGITNIIGIEVPSIGDLAYAASYLPLVEEDLSAIIAVGVHVRGDGQDSIPTVISEVGDLIACNNEFNTLHSYSPHQ